MNTCAMDQCRNEVAIQSTGECRKHYRSRWHREKGPKPKGKVIPTSPCTYGAAHMRVKRWRGKATEYTCTCGNQAEEWAYLTGSPFEITGPYTVFYADGRKYVTTVSWSPAIWDYTPLCKTCHVAMDNKVRADHRETEKVA